MFEQNEEPLPTQQIAHLEKEAVLSYYDGLYQKYLGALNKVYSLKEKVSMLGEKASLLEDEKHQVLADSKSRPSEGEEERTELRRLLKIRADEVDEWRHKYSALEREYLNFRKANLQCVTKGKEIERHENFYELSAVGEELNQWRLKCFQLEETAIAKERTLEEEIHHLRELLTVKNMEIEELRYQIPHSLQSLSVHNAQSLLKEQGFMEQIRAYEEEIGSLQLQVERLTNRLASQKEGEAMPRETLIKSKESTVTRDLEYQNSILIRKEEIITQLNKQVQEISRSCEEKSRSLEEKSREVLLLQKDVENQRKQLLEKEKLVTELLGKIGSGAAKDSSKKQSLAVELQVKAEELRQCKEELRQSREEARSLAENAERRRKKYKSLKKQLSEAKQKEIELTVMIENQKRKWENVENSQSSSLIINGLRTEYEQKLRIAEETIFQLNARIQEKDLHLAGLNERVVLLERKRPSVSLAASEESEKRASLLNVEIGRLNLQLRQKIQEIEVMKLKLRRLDGGDSASMSLEYENRITLLLREIEEWKLKFAEHELSVASAARHRSTSQIEEAKFRQLSGEVLRLTEILGFKTAEIDDLRQRQDVISLEGRVELQRELEHLQRVLAENNKLLEKSRGSKEEVRLLRSQNQELQERAIRLGSEKEGLLAQNRDLQDRIGKLVSERERESLLKAQTK